MDALNTQADTAPEKRESTFARLRHEAYVNLIDGGPKTVTIVEREDAPMTFWQNVRAMVVGGMKGAAISGVLSSIGAAIFGAISGIDSSDKFINDLETKGNVKLGGFENPVFGTSPTVTLDTDTLGNALQTNPTLTGMALSGTNAALNVGVSAAAVGSVVGAIKGGWADRVIKERVIKKVQATEIG